MRYAPTQRWIEKIQGRGDVFQNKATKIFKVFSWRSNAI